MVVVEDEGKTALLLVYGGGPLSISHGFPADCSWLAAGVAFQTTTSETGLICSMDWVMFVCHDQLTTLGREGMHADS